MLLVYIIIASVEEGTKHVFTSLVRYSTKGHSLQLAHSAALLSVHSHGLALPGSWHRCQHGPVQRYGRHAVPDVAGERSTATGSTPHVDFIPRFPENQRP